jgi:hypothetical protein
MDKVTQHIDDYGNEFVIIDRGNDLFTSMTKAEYERQQAEQSTLGLVNSDNPAEPVV